MGERIGILGGTFDPIHVGHLVAAVNAHHDLGLDRVVLMVANVPWQKAGARLVTPAEDRFAMVKAAVGEVPGLEASRLEIDRGGPSYTADTIAELRTLHPHAELLVIVGWDVSAELSTWERLEEIRDLATLVVVNRPGTLPPVGLLQDGWRLKGVTVPNLEILEHGPAGPGRQRAPPRLPSPGGGCPRHQGAWPVFFKWMTTALGVNPEPALTAPSGTPDVRTRSQRRSDRRKRRTEKVVAVLVLLVALIVTVVLLGLQWLGNQGQASLAPIPTSHTFLSEVQSS